MDIERVFAKFVDQGWDLETKYKLIRTWLSFRQALYEEQFEAFLKSVVHGEYNVEEM